MESAQVAVTGVGEETAATAGSDAGASGSVPVQATLADLIDTAVFQGLMDSFFKLTGIGVGILDMAGNVLVQTGWQELCLKFHRINPKTLKNCQESDLQLSQGIPAGQFKAYKCKNNLWDIATPIMIDGRQLGNIFLGQFLYTEDKIDLEQFRAQARKYGFPDAEYLAALEKLPRWSRETVNSAMEFYSRLAQMITELGYSKIELAKALSANRVMLARISESEKRHQAMIANIADVIVIVDKDGINRYKSPNIEKWFGWKPEEVVGRPALENIHPDDLLSVQETLNDLFATPDSFRTGQTRYRCRDGSYKWMEFSATNLLYNPDIGGVLCNYRDISGRKQTEDALRDSEARNRALLNAIPDFMLLQDADGVYLDYHARDESMLAMSPDLFLGKKTHKVLPKSLADEFMVLFRRVRENGTTEMMEYELDMPGGRKTFEARVSRVDGDRVLSIIRDITERKQAESARKESEERFRYLVESAPVGMSLMRVDGSFAFFNRKFISTFGYTLEDVPDKESWFRHAYPDPEYRREIVDVWNVDSQQNGTADKVVSREFCVRCKDGQDRIIQFQVVNLNDGSQLLCYEDITERIKMEERLRQAQKMDAIGQLAGGVAHDFNNQLVGVLGYGDMLLKRLEDPTLRRYAENICAAARRSADLTAKLLAFSRKGQFQMIAVDLHKIINETVDILQHTIDRKIQLQQHLLAPYPIVTGDPSQLQNALLNLGLNARDAMPEGGKLSFGTMDLHQEEPLFTGQGDSLPAGRYLQITVADTGKGMSPEVKEHVFEPFFTTKEQGKGIGMGLPAVYGTVKQHNGGVSVYTETGHGTEFKIYLPLAAEEQVLIDIEADKGTAESMQKLRILIVEDEDQVSRLISAVLEDAGHEVVRASDGSEGFDIFRREWQDLDLVVLDMIMPKMSGKETFIRMKHINPQVRVLLASGYSLNQELRDLLDQGVAGFIQKPFESNQFLTAVAAAMQSAQEE